MIKSLLEYNESFTYPNWVFHNINVNFSRVYFVIGGEAFYEDTATNIKIKMLPNHLYYFPVMHTFNLYDDLENRLNHTYLHVTTDPPIKKFIDIDCSSDAFLSDAVALLRKYVKNQNAPDKVMRISDFITSYVFDEYNLLSDESTAAANIRDYIDTHISDSINLDDLVKIFGYSRSQLIKIFRQAYSDTPMNYCKNKKLEQAIELFKKGCTITQTSLSLNYYSIHNFSRAFKIKYGVSPQTYCDTFLRKKYFIQSPQ